MFDTLVFVRRRDQSKREMCKCKAIDYKIYKFVAVAGTSVRLIVTDIQLFSGDILQISTYLHYTRLNHEGINHSMF